MTDLQAEILGEVATERDRQDAKWGGPDHDDQHTAGAWLSFIEGKTFLAGRALRLYSPDQYRKRLIHIAALAVAAVESMDRKDSAFDEHGVARL